MLQTKIDKIPFSSHLPPNSLATLRSAFAFFVNDSGAIPLMRNMACVLRFASWPFFALFRLSWPANYYLKLSRGIGQLTLTQNTVLCCRYSRALYNNTLAPRAAETKHYGKRRGDGGVAIKGGRLGPGQTKERGITGSYGNRTPWMAQNTDSLGGA